MNDKTAIRAARRLMLIAVCPAAVAVAYRLVWSDGPLFLFLAPFFVAGYLASAAVRWTGYALGWHERACVELTKPKKVVSVVHDSRTGHRWAIRTDVAASQNDGSYCTGCHLWMTDHSIVNRCTETGGQR